MRNSHKIKILIFFALFVIAITGYNVFAGNQEHKDVININNIYKSNTAYLSNGYTQKETNLQQAISLSKITDEYKKFAESNNLEVYVKEDDLSIRVLDKVTNYVWGSSFNTEGENLNRVWRAIVNSAITIDYYDNQNNMKSESITTDAKSQVTVSYFDNGFIGNITFGISNIQLEMKVYLEKDNLKVEIINDTIEENEDFKIGNIRIYPFFGAVKEDNIPGYIFLPDGTGALMRFEKINKNDLVKYKKPVYNYDTALYEPSKNNGLLKDDEQIYFPIFGMVHGINQNGFIASIDEGASYAFIAANPAGAPTDFNYAYTEFSYRSKFNQPTSSNSSIELLQKQKNKFNILLNYQFLQNDDANYVGMALKYQQHLVSQGLLSKNIENREDIPMRIEFLGLEKTPGLFLDEKIKMTTVSQMSDIIHDIRLKGINDLAVVYKGWSKGGLTGSSPYYFPIDKKLGREENLSSLSKELEKQNIDFFLYSDYIEAYEKTKGYNKYYDLAKKINSQLFYYDMFYYDYYLLKPTSSSKIFKNDIKNYQQYNINNIALGTIGKRLFSDYSSGTVSREDSIKIYQNMLNQYNGNIALYQANNYLLSNLKYYFDVPMYSSQYQRFSDTVPFIPIVLNGYIESYAPYGNFFSDTTDELLRMIDFGVNPSFIFTHESSYYLMNTPSEIFTSRYEDWKDEMLRQYNYVNDALKFVHGETVRSRELLETGIVKITYSNDVTIIVNYSNDLYEYNGIQIDGKNYYVFEKSGD